MTEKYTTSRAICCGLQVPWIRDAVVSALRVHFAAAGRNQSALARAIGVSPASVRRWLHDDPELRAALYAPRADAIA
jgi:hypothetical protein